MQIQWLKGEEQEKRRFSESQCYAKEGEEVLCVCKHITDLFCLPTSKGCQVNSSAFINQCKDVPAA